MSNKYPSKSHYNYAGNNPVGFIDIQGLAEFSVTSYSNSDGANYKTSISILSSAGGGNNLIVHVTRATTDNNGNVIMQPSVSYALSLNNGSLVYNDNGTGDTPPEEIATFISAFSTKFENTSTGETTSFGWSVYESSGDQKDKKNPLITETVTNSEGELLQFSTFKAFSINNPKNNPSVSDQQSDRANNIPKEPYYRIDPNTGKPVAGTGGANFQHTSSSNTYEGTPQGSIRTNNSTGITVTRKPIPIPE